MKSTIQENKFFLTFIAIGLIMGSLVGYIYINNQPQPTDNVTQTETHSEVQMDKLGNILSKEIRAHENADHNHAYRIEIQMVKSDTHTYEPVIMGILKSDEIINVNKEEGIITAKSPHDTIKTISEYEFVKSITIAPLADGRYTDVAIGDSHNQSLQQI